MSDVIISRHGGAGSSSGVKLVTEYITSNQTYVVPNIAKNNEFSVRIFGGGGAGRGSYTGGASGLMNNDVLTLTPGELVRVSIGLGANAISEGTNVTGGTTTFGGYLSANGGTYCIGGSTGFLNNNISGTNNNSNALQFGGSIGCNFAGPWGGGGGGYIREYKARSCGSGGIYGGSGGHGLYINTGYVISTTDGIIATAGTYGGTGGQGTYRNINSTGGMYTGAIYNLYLIVNSIGNVNHSGEYGGNGGLGAPNHAFVSRQNAFANFNQNGLFYNKTCLYPSTVIGSNMAENGTNTIGFSNVEKDQFGIYLNGSGKSGALSVAINNNMIWSGSGGGGYGGVGGNGVYFVNINQAFHTNGTSLQDIILSGGGGGGYGSKGGNGMINYCGADKIAIGGGGGGYGGTGGDGSAGGGGGGYGKQSVGRYGGGGYYCPGGGRNATWGGGGFGIWSNSSYFIASYGSGANNNKKAEDGICVIQYYV